MKLETNRINELVAEPTRRAPGDVRTEHSSEQRGPQDQHIGIDLGSNDALSLANLCVQIEGFRFDCQNYHTKISNRPYPIEHTTRVFPGVTMPASAVNDRQELLQILSEVLETTCDSEGFL